MRLVKVRFPQRAAASYFDPKGLELEEGDWVIVETERGQVAGEVISFREGVKELEVPPVIRKVTGKERKKVRRLREKERKASELCERLIEELGLPMKLVGVEYLFDESKAIFYFTAEGRVDFRTLIRMLASQLRTRIEMRQIGVRDEAKIVGGIGPCGRELCCATFLRNFDLVSIRMAKEQSLPVNPEKISGLCGRLMCCLTFEMETYQELKEELPRVGKRVMTKYGEGKVIRCNILLQTVTVELEGGGVITLGINEVQKK